MPPVARVEKADTTAPADLTRVLQHEPAGQLACEQIAKPLGRVRRAPDRPRRAGFRHGQTSGDRIAIPDARHQLAQRPTRVGANLAPHQGLVRLGLAEGARGIAGCHLGHHRLQHEPGVQGVRRHETAPPFGGGREIAPHLRGSRERLQRAGCPRGILGSLSIDPVLELGCPAQVKAIEERARVEPRELLQVARRPSEAEIADIARQRGRIQGEAGAPDEQVGHAEIAPEDEEGLTKGIPGVFVVALRPQTGDDAVAAHPGLRACRQQHQQGQAPARQGPIFGGRVRFASRRPQTYPAERRQPQHCGLTSSALTAI